MKITPARQRVNVRVRCLPQRLFRAVSRALFRARRCGRASAGPFSRTLETRTPPSSSSQERTPMQRVPGRKLVVVALHVILISLVVASESRAQGFISPFLGYNFGGD